MEWIGIFFPSHTAIHHSQWAIFSHNASSSYISHCYVSLSAIDIQLETFCVDLFWVQHCFSLLSLVDIWIRIFWLCRGRGLDSGSHMMTILWGARLVNGVAGSE